MALFASCICTFTSSRALAEPSPPAAKNEARERFDRGIALFNDGDNAGALAEFKRAYELIPNPLVLYNIGLVYAAMGRPVDAVAALDKVLAAPGSLAEDKLARAKRTHAEQSARIASLVVATNVPATLQIDNVEVGTTPLQAPLRVAGGVHVIGAVASGYAPTRKEVTVAGGDKAEVRLELTQMEGRVAHVSVKSHLPAADVVVDDQVAGKTPLPQSLTLAPGKHVVELRRAGYVSARQELNLGEGASAEVALEPEEDRAAIATGGGRLALDLSESLAVVTIDGRSRGPYTESLRLAPGLHRLLVERGGFEPVERDVDVAPGTSTTVHIVLDPTPETRASYADRTSSRRTWGLIALGGGALVAGGAVGFLVWNAGKRSDAKRDFDAAEANVTNKVGICDSATTTFDQDKCNSTAKEAESRVNAANARNVYGYVGLGLGAIGAGFGAYLLFTNDDPHRYDRTRSEASVWRSLRPFAWTSAHGGGAAVVGAF